jgi:hypothetical protein
LIATSAMPDARSAAGSRPFEVSIATLIGCSHCPCCSASIDMSSLNPAAVSAMRSRTRCLPSSSTTLTS